MILQFPKKEDEAKKMKEREENGSFDESEPHQQQDSNFFKVHLPWFNSGVTRGSLAHKISLDSRSSSGSKAGGSTTGSSMQKFSENSLSGFSTSDKGSRVDKQNKKSPLVHRGRMTRPKSPSSTSANTMKLPWVLYENPDKSGPAVLLITSAFESTVKYAEVIHSLFTEVKCSVYTIELRCQGFSTRTLEGEDKVHVDSFKEYVCDMLCFIDTVIHPHMEQFGRNRDDLCVLAHGVGGLIAAKLATKYAGIFRKLALLSPYFAPNLRGAKWKLMLATKLHCKMGKSTDMLLNNAGKDGGASSESFPSLADKMQEGVPPNMQSLIFSLPLHNRSMSSPVIPTHRQHVWERLKIAYPCVAGVPTYQWLSSILATKLKPSKVAKRLEGVPVLVCTGSNDPLLDHSEVHKFVHAAPNCKHRVLLGADHDLLLERDSIRSSVMKEIRNFLKMDPATEGWNETPDTAYGWGKQEVKMDMTSGVGSGT